MEIRNLESFIRVAELALTKAKEKTWVTPSPLYPPRYASWKMSLASLYLNGSITESG